jgi:predicted TIM-barrel fold metal-dependent hydrolase
LTRSANPFKNKGNYDHLDIKAFQDYLFMKICEIAAELDVPIQIHTGLGRLTRSNAYLLQPLIEAFPMTKFVLLHGSYPWIDDILGLVHVYPKRVFPDLVWLPQISTEAAVRMLSELIEVTNSHSICWRDDSWTSKETYGSLLSAQHVLATVLSNKVHQGYMSLPDAQVLVANILRDNAKRLYKLD